MQRIIEMKHRTAQYVHLVKSTLNCILVQCILFSFILYIVHFHQRGVDNIDVSSSVLPFLGCTDPYGEIDYKSSVVI